MISWHASALHAALSTVRELVVERVDVASDLLAHVRESVDASARVDLVSLTVARLVRRVAENDAEHCRTRDELDYIKAALLNQERRLRALESAVDKDAK